MDKIFLDTDVIIDLLAERKPFHEETAELLSLARKGRIKCYTSSISIANIYYILSRLKNINFARRSLIKLRAIISVSGIDEKIVDVALGSNFKDFEDALQYYAATQANLDAIITRNKKDYVKSKIPVLSASEYLGQRGSE